MNKTIKIGNSINTRIFGLITVNKAAIMALRLFDRYNETKKNNLLPKLTFGKLDNKKTIMKIDSFVLKKCKYEGCGNSNIRLRITLLKNKTRQTCANFGETLSSLYPIMKAKMIINNLTLNIKGTFVKNKAGRFRNRRIKNK